MSQQCAEPFDGALCRNPGPLSLGQRVARLPERLEPVEVRHGLFDSRSNRGPTLHWRVAHGR